MLNKDKLGVRPAINYDIYVEYTVRHGGWKSVVITLSITAKCIPPMMQSIGDMQL